MGILVENGVGRIAEIPVAGTTFPVQAGAELPGSVYRVHDDVQHGREKFQIFFLQHLHESGDVNVDIEIVAGFDEIHVVVKIFRPLPGLHIIKLELRL